MQLSVCHLGYRPSSPKSVILCPGSATPPLPAEIPFFLRQNCLRLRRDRPEPEGFNPRFPCPYDPLNGRLSPEPGSYFLQGSLMRVDSRWGTFWQGRFDARIEEGSYQIETDLQVSAPFAISERIYDRLVRGFLTFLHAQRCGCEVPGVHPACHLDDGILDEDGSYWPSGGGWHDAGDFRKWLSLTQGNLESLTLIATHGHAGFRSAALDEIRWGNHLFHRMITNAGQVYEDVAGGSAPADPPRDYEKHWWFENLPGCYGDASDNRWTDNIPNSGDERRVRTTYNPAVQFAFVRTQALCSRVLPDAEGMMCRALAERAWRYGHARGHDRRTLFLAHELLAALELPELAGGGVIRSLVRELISRQETRKSAVTGFFWEAESRDAYRSIAYAGHPAWALLRLIERQPADLGKEVDAAREAVQRYCDGYLVADAGSNPFGLTPYGVYRNPEQPERQTFRDAGEGLGIRTFIHPFNWQGIVHGTSSVVTSHAAVLAKAAVLLDRPDWSELAERQLQWTLGHNTLNRALYNGIGYRQPVAYGFRVPQIPEGTVAGFIGRPDDSPYLEESFAIEWNTLEHWDVPYAYAINAAVWVGL